MEAKYTYKTIGCHLLSICTQPGNVSISVRNTLSNNLVFSVEGQDFAEARKNLLDRMCFQLERNYRRQLKTLQSFARGL